MNYWIEVSQHDKYVFSTDKSLVQDKSRIVGLYQTFCATFREEYGWKVEVYVAREYRENITSEIPK